MNSQNKAGIKNYKKLIKNEVLLFSKEYKSYFKPNESKPKKIGQPFLLKNKDAKTGVLLIHGLMAAPEEVKELGEFFFSKGFSVYAPRLAGHGTSPEDLSSRKYNEWIESVNRGYEIIKNLCDNVIVAGFSTGAGIALFQALNYPDRYKAVISISAPLKFKSFSANFTEIADFFNKIPDKNLDKFKKIFVKNHPDNPHINYKRCPISSIAEVRKMMRKVYRKLPYLSLPSLIIQADKDPKVDGKSGMKIYSRIKNPFKLYHEVNFNEHGIVLGEITKKTFIGIDSFLIKIKDQFK